MGTTFQQLPAQGGSREGKGHPVGWAALFWQCEFNAAGVSTVGLVGDTRVLAPCSGHTLSLWEHPSTEMSCGCVLGLLTSALVTSLLCPAACAPGSFGQSCSQKCWCQHGSSCDPVHGACSCPAGFYGTSCEHGKGLSDLWGWGQLFVSPLSHLLGAVLPGELRLEHHQPAPSSSGPACPTQMG